MDVGTAMPRAFDADHRPLSVRELHEWAVARHGPASASGSRSALAGPLPAVGGWGALPNRPPRHLYATDEPLKAQAPAKTTNQDETVRIEPIASPASLRWVERQKLDVRRRAW